MDPQQEIATYLRSKGVQHAVLRDMLDQFAHDLAEAQRADARLIENENDCCRKYGMVLADLIDPQARD